MAIHVIPNNYPLNLYGTYAGGALTINPAQVVSIGPIRKRVIDGVDWYGFSIELSSSRIIQPLIENAGEGEEANAETERNLLIAAVEATHPV